MEAGSRKVKIHYRDQVRNVIVKNNVIQKSMILQYYSANAKLFSKIDEVLFLLELNEINYMLSAHISDYYVEIHLLDGMIQLYCRMYFYIVKFKLLKYYR